MILHALYFYRLFTPMCIWGGACDTLGLHVKYVALWTLYIHEPSIPSSLGHFSFDVNWKLCYFFVISGHIVFINIFHLALLPH